MRPPPCRLAALLALILFHGGCATATLDTARPIEKRTFLLGTKYEQDGLPLGYWSTLAKLRELDVSRASAERSWNLRFGSLGLLTVGTSVTLLAPTASASARTPMFWAGLGLIGLSVIPGNLSVDEYGRAVDAYNGRFQGQTKPAQVAFVVAPVPGGAGLCVAGGF